MEENVAALIYAIISPDYCSVNKALNTMGIHFMYKKRKKEPFAEGSKLKVKKLLIY